MSNKNKPTNPFSPTNQPTPGNTRGKSPKTKSLAALQRKMNMSEDDLYDYIVDKAFDKANPDRDMMDLLLKTAGPVARTTLPSVHFQYDRKLPHHEKCEVVMEAMSKGELPPDVGLDIINSIKSIALVQEQTELVKRIEQLEALLMHTLDPTFASMSPGSSATQ
ncbi:TPA: hypothetical protein QDB28_002073 [Burkholderia vietnamiensis]|uniref:hypothetical protein n=1 Tax=Burkholderia vietnamiensis TaxID=60552 RepID=UPI00158BC790|nr:hypothetical protein [Burkholderia vietnamiensis]HDR9161708.1 hypothetical protein [Burkholderia vietnamiensis]